MNNLKLTLYDVFGYLIPGSIALAASLFIIWALFFPAATVKIIELHVAVWLLIFFGAYLFGHVVQAVANLLPWAFPEVDALLHVSKEGSLARELPHVLLIESAKRKLAQMFDTGPNQIDHALVMKICAKATKLCDGASIDEVYGYMQGFYRGLTLAFFLLSLGLLVRVIRGSPAFILGSVTYSFSWLYVLLLAILSAAFGILTRTRYLRFVSYRAHHSVIAFLFGYPTQGTSPLTKDSTCQH